MTGGIVSAVHRLTIDHGSGVSRRRRTDRRSDCGAAGLGEFHGVGENPLLIRALMPALGLTALALEWPEELSSVIRAFVAGGSACRSALLWHMKRA
jgi:hypothetical protein